MPLTYKHMTSMYSIHNCNVYAAVIILLKLTNWCCSLVLFRLICMYVYKCSCIYKVYIFTCNCCSFVVIFCGCFTFNINFFLNKCFNIIISITVHITRGTSIAACFCHIVGWLVTVTNEWQVGRHRNCHSLSWTVMLSAFAHLTHLHKHRGWCYF